MLTCRSMTKALAASDRLFGTKAAWWWALHARSESHLGLKHGGTGRHWHWQSADRPGVQVPLAGGDHDPIETARVWDISHELDRNGLPLVMCGVPATSGDLCSSFSPPERVFPAPSYPDRRLTVFPVLFRSPGLPCCRLLCPDLSARLPYLT